MTNRFRAPLAAALDVELHRFERAVARALQLFAAVGVIAGAVFTLTIAPDLGLACTATCAAFLMWFVILGWRLERGPAGPALRSASVLVEGALPWVFTVVLVFTEGAAYALASWVPPMLFCALIVAHTARLRWRSALLVGAIGGLVYPTLYFVLVRDRLPEDVAEEILYQGPMQVTRSISLVVASCIGAFVAWNLRAAIGRAEIVVREQDLFGKYRLVRRIAKGGMGEVLEAVYCPEGGFERRVAIKRIHPHLVEQPRFVDGFRAEAEIGARLAHPNIVQVLDFGRVAGTYFLAMEYVDGIALNVFMRQTFQQRRTLPPHLVGAILSEILAGLAHAHEAALGADGRPLRVVHRDLCPQNVLLSKNGEVKITDFGVARALKDSAVSQTQTVVGHVAYMAPEQALGGAVDPRSDLFPMGVMLWELLVGRQLFRRDNQGATLMALLHEDPPPVRRVRPDLHPGWDAVIRRAVSRDPKDRYGSAREMAAALDAVPGARAQDGTSLLGALVAELVVGRASEEPADEAPTLVELQAPPAP